MSPSVFRPGTILGIVVLSVLQTNEADETGPAVHSAPIRIPELVAHRGASHDAPENTLPAFNVAWEQNADAIEGDFHLTKDGKIICFHDKSLERVTMGTDKRLVAEMTFKELRNIDVGLWQGAHWRGLRMPTLMEVLDTVPDGKKMLIEIKCGPEIVPVLKKTLAATDKGPDQLRIISFGKDVVTECRRALPHIKTYWLTAYSEQPKGSGNLQPTFDSVMATLQKTKASGLDSFAHDFLSEKDVARLRKANLEFHVWTVDDPTVAARFSLLGVDSITTNRPGKMREALSRWSDPSTKRSAAAPPPALAK